MNGPGSFFKGDSMPEKKTAPSWTVEDEDVAKRFLEASRRYAGTFQEKKDPTAHALGFNSYREMPQGVRSYISHVGQLAKREKKENNDRERIAHNLAQMEREWLERYHKDEAFRLANTLFDDEEQKGE